MIGVFSLDGKRKEEAVTFDPPAISVYRDLVA